MDYSYFKKWADFRKQNKNNWVTLAAWGPGNKCYYVDKTPGENEIIVFAGKGGRQLNWQYPEETGYFSIPKDEYKNYGEYGHVLGNSAVKIA